MSKLTAREVTSKAKGEPGRFSDGAGLYFVVPKSGQSYWMLRFTAKQKRKEMTLGRYGELSLADARSEAAIKMKQIREGFDPLAARKRLQHATITTMDDLFNDWIIDIRQRLKFPQIPERVYRKDIAPHIGSIELNKINARDIREVLKSIKASGRPTICNDALLYCKQLFNHAIKLDLTNSNPAVAFNVNDAGGVEKSRDRALTIEELTFFFQVAKTNSQSFSRDNYLACVLLVTLGTRKSELAEAKWQEFDLVAQIWSLPKSRSKSGIGIEIPLSDIVMNWITELKIRACGSDYVFPSRRKSNLPHMGRDTLNRAISKLFGHEAGRKKQPPNLMVGVEHFTVHDLRRTCRSLLAELGIAGHVAERCLNHKLKGVEGIYNRYDYFDERKQALTLLAQKIASIATE